MNLRPRFPRLSRAEKRATAAREHERTQISAARSQQHSELEPGAEEHERVRDDRHDRSRVRDLRADLAREDAKSCVDSALPIR